MILPKRKSAAFLLLMMLLSGVAWMFRNMPPSVMEGTKFERLTGCVLVDSRSNDGDSFRVKLPNGQERIFRLYFVDAPETGVVSYADGKTSEKRLAHQADYFGGLTQDQTIAVGKNARKWTAELLKKAGSFTVETRNEIVFNNKRHYALVRIPVGSEAEREERWLHELLVEEGLVRVYTKGTNLPDGVEAEQQKRRLHQLEEEARKARKGGWGLASSRNRS